MELHETEADGGRSLGLFTWCEECWDEVTAYYNASRSPFADIRAREGALPSPEPIDDFQINPLTSLSYDSSGVLTLRRLGIDGGAVEVTKIDVSRLSEFVHYAWEMLMAWKKKTGQLRNDRGRRRRKR